MRVPCVTTGALVVPRDDWPSQQSTSNWRQPFFIAQTQHAQASAKGEGLHSPKECAVLYGCGPPEEADAGTQPPSCAR
eukprot:3105430-Prymnesium_polylepis.5